MKKNIRLIKMDSILEKWLLEKLIKDSLQTESRQELLSGIHDMITGEVTSLILSKTGETEINLDVLTAGELEVYQRSRRVVMEGKDISLTPKEFDILYFLIQNKGEVFTKEQIYKAVWSDNYLLDDSNIMAFIRKLRKKIEPNPDEPKYILTIWGIGYKFNDSLK